MWQKPSSLFVFEGGDQPPTTRKDVNAWRVQHVSCQCHVLKEFEASVDYSAPQTTEQQTVCSNGLCQHSRATRRLTE